MQMKDDDIKIPLPKQDNHLPNDAYYFMNVNDPATNTNYGHTPNY